MSRIKNAQIRYRVIDRCIGNKYAPYPTKENLRKACEEALYGSDVGEDICDSTIEKDMRSMRDEFDAPIKYSKIYKGYYYTDPAYSIDKIPLSEDDIEAIKFASSTLMQFRHVGLFKQFGFAIDKIFDRVHIATNPLEESVDNFVQFETVHESAGGNEMLPEFLKAIKDKTIVTFLYRSFSSDKGKDREVLPLLLKEYRNRWYLICFDLERQKVMTFGLDRIEGLVLTDRNYYQPIDFNPDNFFKNSIGITANENEPDLVEFKIDKLGAKYLITQPLHASQELVKEGNTRNTFTLKVIVSEELKMTFLSYGAQLEVIKPKSLRSEIKNRVQQMMSFYE